MKHTINNNTADETGLLVFAKAAIESAKKNKKTIHTAFNVLCFILLAFFVWKFRIALVDALKLSIGTGVKFLWLPLLFIVWNCFATLGWQCIINAAGKKNETSFLKLYSLRVQGQALNMVLPVSGIGGEVLRAGKASGKSGFQKSALAVGTDKIADVSSDALLTFAGVIIALHYFTNRILFSIAAVILVAAIILCIVFWRRVLRKMTSGRYFKKIRTQILAITEDKKYTVAYYKSFAYHLAEHILMAFEIFVAAKLIGVNLGFAELLFVNSISSLFNIMFVVVPGRIGSFECSLAYAFSQLSLTPGAGISVALVRRARQLLICLAGMLLIFLKEKSGRTDEQKQENKDSLSYSC